MKGVIVRFRPLELTSAGIVRRYKRADSYDITEDNTVILLAGDNVIATIHRDRWDAVEMATEAAND